MSISYLWNSIQVKLKFFQIKNSVSSSNNSLQSYQAWVKFQAFWFFFCIICILLNCSVFVMAEFNWSKLKLWPSISYRLEKRIHFIFQKEKAQKKLQNKYLSSFFRSGYKQTHWQFNILNLISKTCVIHNFLFLQFLCYTNIRITFFCKIIHIADSVNEIFAMLVFYWAIYHMIM